MKICKKCGVQKPLTDFPLNRVTYCKTCKNEIEKQRYYKDRERLLTQKREYYYRSRDRRVVVDKARRVRLRFGISLQEYEELKTTLCPICGSENPDSLDHNHNTGEIRSFLCRKCNSGLGFFNDNPILLQQAIKYLENFSVNAEQKEL